MWIGDVPTNGKEAEVAGESIIIAAARNSHSAFVTESGRLFTCGSGRNGQLGHGEHTYYEPRPASYGPKAKLRKTSLARARRRSTSQAEYQAEYKAESKEKLSVQRTNILYRR